MSTCPACGADPGTIGVTANRLCPTCLHREQIIGTPTLAPEPAPARRKMIQLVGLEGTSWAPRQLYCLCDDGTAWVLNGEHHWVQLPPLVYGPS